MPSLQHRSTLVAAWFSLAFSLLYMYPQWLIDNLAGNPVLAALGIRSEFSQVELDTKQDYHVRLLESLRKERCQITIDVIRGERTLLEAASIFQELAARIPYRRQRETDVAFQCHQVIEFVSTQAPTVDGIEVAPILGRLKSELREIQRHRAKIALPR